MHFNYFRRCRLNTVNFILSPSSILIVDKVILNEQFYLVDHFQNCVDIQQN